MGFGSFILVLPSDLLDLHFPRPSIRFSAFKTYLTVVNDRMWKDEKLEEDEAPFKAIEEEEITMVAE